MAVQAQSLYFSEDWSSSAALLHPVSGLDDIFSGIPSPQPPALPPPQNHFHLRLPAAQNQSQNLNTTGFDFCNALGASVSPSTFSSFLPTQFSENFGAQLDLQRHELDCIIQLQVIIGVNFLFCFGFFIFLGDDCCVHFICSLKN